MASAPASPVTPADRLGFTVVVALLLHALLLFGIRFLPVPETSAPLLEVTLVPATSPQAPAQADFLAQANQQGSGSEAEARLLSTPERSPLPGDRPVARPAVPAPRPEAAEAAPAQVVAKAAPERVRPAEPVPRPLPASPAVPLTEPDVDDEIAALEARLSSSRQAYAKRPRVRTLSAVSAREDAWAGYIARFRERVELAGNADYPAEARARGLQGEVRLLVALLPDGRVQRIELLQSSGHAVLDRAAQASVRAAQPFGRFPAAVRDQVDVLQVVRTWRFAETLETGL